MSIQENVQIVKDAFAAIGRGDMRGLQALSAEDIEWIVPGEDWPLAGTRRGHAGLADLLQTESETVESSFFEAREFVAQGDRVLVVGFTRGKIIATNVRGQLDLRHYRSKWQTDERPRVYRHASTGAGLRDGRKPQALTHRPIRRAKGRYIAQAG